MSSSATARAGNNSNNAPDTNALPKSQSMPVWVPVSLLALTTAALAVPLVLLKRHKATSLSKALKDAPPPPRRTSTVGGSVRRPSSSTRAAGASSAASSIPKQTPPGKPDENFNDPFYGVKAFGYATLMVTTGAIVSVWGVKTYMGVNNTQEFAARMRYHVQTKMPGLLARLHRPPEEEDHTLTVWNSPTLAGEVPQVVVKDDIEWAWPDAESRLKAAYETDGFSGWAQAALEELEAEGKTERRRRGQE